MTTEGWTSSDVKCVVLCAGKGTRLLPITEKIPKVMIEVNGKPILHYVVDYWKRFTRDFIFIVNYKKEHIIDFVKTLPVNAVCVEQKELRGIAHALTYAEPYIKDKFILVLGDCICTDKIEIPQRMEQGIGVWRTLNKDDIKKSYSVEIFGNKVMRVIEKPKRLPNNLCGMGFYFFNKKVFSYVKKTPPSPLRNEIEITDVIQKMIDSGLVITPVFFRGSYINIGNQDDLAVAEKILSDT